MSSDKPEFVELDPPEKKRTYHFPGRSITLKNVVALCVRPSGSHRLETADGRKWIVPPSWLAIELEVEAWTL